VKALRFGQKCVVCQCESCRKTNLDEGVVQDEHDGSEPPRPLLVPEKHLANITDISNFRMSQTEFPQDKRAKHSIVSEILEEKKKKKKKNQVRSNIRI
jgi:hypothetical protein